MLYIGTLIQCRPLREVVSWNLHCHAPAPFLPRSTSSWGRELKYWRHYLVEGHCVSTSSWGRELKFCVNITSSCYSGRPLREVVSWNSCHPLSGAFIIVDLFVRSWVEIHIMIIFVCLIDVDLFVRSWVEMLLPPFPAHRPLVDLFVRSWVEIQYTDFLTYPGKSTSSWGRELKYFMWIWVLHY